MPKSKKADDETKVVKPVRKASKKRISKSKSGATKSPKTSSRGVTKKKDIKSVKKAKPVIIDVISDDLGVKGDENFFSDASLAEKEKKTEEIELGSSIENKNDISLTDNVDWDLPAEEIDRQKQFFSDLVSDMKKRKIADAALDANHNLKVGSQKIPKKSLNLYKRLAWNFLILVGFLAAVVIYFSFAKLTIFITPQVEAMNDVLFLRVNSDDQPTEARIVDVREQISGSINELELFVEKTYLATGEEFLGEEVSGRVTIINNNNKDQALVATTRLLTPDGKLFRIKEGVSVPAGGRVEVEVYADKVSADMAISPTRFTIPGLWVGLQDKIYAESKEAFDYKQKVQKYIKASDIQLANSEASSLLLNKARELKPLRTQDGLLYQIIDPLEIKISAKSGDKQDSFTMEAKAQVVIVSFSKEEVERLAKAKLNLLIPDDKELLQIKPENISYVLEAFNDQDQTATIKASFSGLMILKGNAEVIDREKLKQLTADQISTYLKDFPEIGEYELNFQPSFIKRAPYLVDRIEIKIKK